MPLKEELTLLIKSKFPLIYIESVDEDYCIRQITEIADELELIHYEWSVTEGLRKAGAKASMYKTNDPVIMLRSVLGIVDDIKYDEAGLPPMLVVMRDIHKYFNDSVIVRYLKDIISNIKSTKNTVIMVSSERVIPKELEPDVAYILGGYPGAEEIKQAVLDSFTENFTAEQRDKLLEKNSVEHITDALKGLTLQQIRNILNRSIVEDNFKNSFDTGIIEKYKKQIFDQDGLLDFCATEIKDKLAGFDNLKRWLSERKSSFRGINTSLPAPKGILLMGIQGCGKSQAIKVIAKELDLSLYRLDTGKLYSKWAGETEENLRKVLALTDKLQPLCLWIDEIEKGLATSSGEQDAGTSQRMLSTFLTWMQEHTTRCFLAATANNIYQLPPELLRKGRFDEIFFVDLPNENQRVDIFKIHISKRGLDSNVFDCKDLAKSSVDFSGAEIEQAIISAFYRASADKQAISTRHILEEIKSTKPLAVLRKEDINSLRSWARNRTIPA